MSNEDHLLGFEACSPYLEAALEYAEGTHSLEDIREGVRKGSLQFWPGASSAVITQIAEYPRKRVLHFFLAGGNLAELEAMYPAILAWGAATGCDAAMLTGRKGWERTFLAREGWKPSSVTFSKSLE